jgi:hypothetical protein
MEEGNVKRGREKALNGKYGYDPMCGSIRP